MNAATKTYVRFFTIVDYEAEEIWMRKMHQQGGKPADTGERENELFTDPASKFNAIRKVIRRHLFLTVFSCLCSVLPNLYNIWNGLVLSIYQTRAWQILWACMLITYAAMTIYDVVGLQKLKKKYQ